jgi:hypothetical protein
MNSQLGVSTVWRRRAQGASRSQRAAVGEPLDKSITSPTIGSGAEAPPTGSVPGIQGALAAPGLATAVTLKAGQIVFTTVEEWIGRVDSVDDDGFDATLWNAAEPDDEQLARFGLRQVSNQDLELVTPGAVFYWTLGYRDEPDGDRLAASIVRLRRGRAASEAEVAAAERAVRARARFLFAEDPDE